MADYKDTELLIQNLTACYGSDRTDRLVAYIDKVLERNEHINLTAVRDRDEAMQKHLADSLAVTTLPEYKKAHRIIDVLCRLSSPGIAKFETS